MKKKIKLIIAAIVVVCAVVAGFFCYPFVVSKDMQETIGVNFNDVDKVTIGSGTTGKTYDIVGKENLQEFFAIFKDAKLKKNFDQQASSGFIYSAILYKSNKELVGFNFGYTQLNVSKGNQYTKYVSNKNIDQKQVEAIAQKYKLNN